MRRLLPWLGIMLALALSFAGFGLGAVGLMAMGIGTPKLVVIVGGVLLLLGGAALVRSVLALRGARPEAST